MQNKNINYSQSEEDLEYQNDDILSIENQDDGNIEIKSLEEQADQEEQIILYLL